MPPRHIGPGAGAQRGAPFRVLSPRAVSPVILTCEHATNRLPVPVRRTGEIRRVLASHWGLDLGAWALTRDLSRRLAATAIGGRWSRLWIDLNRRIDDPTLIRRDAEGVALPWNADLSPDDVERRMVAYHAPYHGEVDRLIVRRAVRGVRPLMIAVHTFTPELNGRVRRFDVGVLYRDHARLAWKLGRRLRRAGLSVRYNEPYSGLAGLMYAIDRHSTHHDLPCLELEIRQDLLADDGAVTRIAAIVAPALDELARMR